jgi:hypothetical protein
MCINLELPLSWLYYRQTGRNCWREQAMFGLRNILDGARWCWWCSGEELLSGALLRRSRPAEPHILIYALYGEYAMLASIQYMIRPINPHFSDEIVPRSLGSIFAGGSQYLRALVPSTFLISYVGASAQSLLSTSLIESCHILTNQPHTPTQRTYVTMNQRQESFQKVCCLFCLWLPRSLIPNMNSCAHHVLNLAR